MAGDALRIPTESQEQQWLFAWARAHEGKYPALRLMYHVPNGGSRRKSEAGRFRAEGVKAGVPDIFLPVARGDYHGLYIELKRTRGGRVSDEQRGWIAALEAEGYRARVCAGGEAAAAEIVGYLRLGAGG